MAGNKEVRMALGVLLLLVGLASFGFQLLGAVPPIVTTIVNAATLYIGYRLVSNKNTLM